MVDQELLRKKCREVLRKDEVEAIIGHKKKKPGLGETIAFFQDPDDLKHLVFTPLSEINPVPLLYEELQRVKGKLGVVLKGCDSRSVVQLVQENEIDLDEVYQIGVSCPGVVNGKKLERRLRKEGFSNEEIDQIEDISLSPDEKEIIVEDENGSKHSFPFQDLISNNCSVCNHPTPKTYDFLIGEKRTKSPGPGKPELKHMAEQENWNYWEEEFDKCIRCFACRNACPVCYCEECIVDPDDIAISPDTPPEKKAARPKWLGRIVDVPENAFFHLVKAIHHAGRCVDCGECERACPMDIPLRKLERKLIQEVKDLFDHEAGIDPEETSFEGVAELEELEGSEV